MIRIVKRLIFLALCIISFNMNMNAQEVYVELKLNQYFGDIKFDQSLNVEGKTNVDNHAKNYSLAVTAQVNEHFFLKSSLSSNDFRRLMSVNWEQGGDSYRINGSFSGDQKVLEILPEFRYFKNNMLFVNAGIGVTGLKNGTFSEGGTKNGNDWQIENLEGYYHHFAANLGINIQRDIVGVVLELGYRNSGKLESSNAPFQMAFKQFGMKLGISYRLRDAKKKDLESM